MTVFLKVRNLLRLFCVNMNYLKIIPETITDGEGLRTAIYVSGCENHCKGCFNPESWDYKAGQELTDKVIDDFIENIRNNPLLEGVSILGGDPFAPCNRTGLLNLLEKLNNAGITDIWCWTGYVLEELKKDITALKCLRRIRTLVDGPYVEALKSTDIRFRGSTNQRIIYLRGDD